MQSLGQVLQAFSPEQRTAGISGFRKMLSHMEQVSPIRRNVTPEDVDNAAAFLCSDLAAGIAGEILYVDGGYNTIGMHLDE